MHYWKTVKTNIDFSKHEPIETFSSLHIHEERFEIDGNLYRLLHGIGHDADPLIEVKVKK